MSASVFALPVSIEQITVAIKRMNPAEQRHLLELAPDLRQIALQSVARTRAQAQATVAALRTSVLQAVNHQLLASDEPFLGDVTLREYQSLSDAEKAKLWDQWAEADLLTMPEREVRADALSPR